MLRLGGGSVIDVLYAYSRTCSILNKIKPSDQAGSDYPNTFTSEAEHSLGLLLCEFGDIIRKSTEARAPHLLVGYLIELTKLHGQFYEGSLVIGVDDKAIFNLRVSLHRAYKTVIENALNILNIPVTERL
jgi:arginyl-tRNA synthetase